MNNQVGTYIGLRPSIESSKLLRAYFQNQNIIMSTPDVEQRLHVTLIYSRVKIDIIPNSLELHRVKISEISLFPNNRGQNTVLVAKLNAPSLIARHNYIRSSYGATHDYPEFIPHLTLDYYWDNYKSIQEIKIPNFEFILCDEYVEPLDLSWGQM